MIKPISLPGSGPPEGDPPGVSAARGRFSEDELGALSELAHWWRFRQSLHDSADPLESHFGGVDGVCHVRTAGLTPATLPLDRPLLPTTGATLLVVALGVPDPLLGGEAYSIFALCHFVHDGSAWLSRYATIGRVPAATISTEIATAIDILSGVPQLVLTGVAGLNIDWKVEFLRLEVE